MSARPEPLPVWDRRGGKKLEEFMDDAPQTYETRPRRSLRQWLEAQPLYDWLIALRQESSSSAKKIKIAFFISSLRDSKRAPDVGETPIPTKCTPSPILTCRNLPRLLTPVRDWKSGIDDGVVG